MTTQISEDRLIAIHREYYELKRKMSFSIRKIAKRYFSETICHISKIEVAIGSLLHWSNREGDDLYERDDIKTIISEPKLKQVILELLVDDMIDHGMITRAEKKDFIG